MGFPALLGGMALWELGQRGLTGVINAATPSFDKLKRGDLPGAIQEYYKDGPQGVVDRLYTGFTKGDIFSPRVPGQEEFINGAIRVWNPRYGWQLPKVASTPQKPRQSPIQYDDKGAPIDPKTNKPGVGSFTLIPPVPVLPPPDDTPTLASVPPKTEQREVIDSEKARAAVAAAEKYKKEQSDISEAHKNYKTMREFGGEPVVTQDYMEQDAMRIWANANPELAKKLIEKHQLDSSGIFSKPKESTMPASEETPFSGATTVAQLLSPNPTGTNWNNLSTEPVGNIGDLFSNPESILAQAEDKNKFFYTSSVPTAMPMVNSTVNTQMPSITIAGNGFKYN